MTVQTLRRPHRLPPPTVPSAARPVPAPPQLQPPPTGAAAWLPYLLPMLGSAGALLFVLNNPSPLTIAAASLFAAGSLGVGVAMGYVQRSSARSRTAENRTRYLDLLRRLRHESREIAAAQRAAGRWRHPDPGQL